MRELDKKSIEEQLKVSLREYVDLRFAIAEKEVSNTKHTSSVALEKAETALTKRLDLMNEFRGALDDSTKRLMPRMESEIAIQKIREYIDLRFGVQDKEVSEAKRVTEKELGEAKRVAEKEVAEAKRIAAESINEAKDLMQERLRNTDAKIQDVCSDVDKLKELTNIVKGKASQNAYLFGLFLSLLALGLTILNLLKPIITKP